MSEGVRPVVFISYAREDVVFVRRLDESLRLKGIDVRGDWQLTRGERFDEELRRFIRDADAVVFVITPDSLMSGACASELTTADVMKKRVLPVLHRDVQDTQELHVMLREPQWAFLRETDDFVTEVDRLVEAISTDFDLLPDHRRLLAFAEEWIRNGRSKAFLLRKEGLASARAWLHAVGSRGPGRMPQPTALQTEYVVASQRARTRGVQIGLAVVAALMLVFAVVSIFALHQRSVAVTNAGVAKANEAEALRQKAVAQKNADEREVQRKLAVKKTEDEQHQRTIAEGRKEEAEKNLAAAYLREARLRRREADRSSAALLAARAVELDDNFFTRAELGLAMQDLPVAVRTPEDSSAPAAWSPTELILATGSKDAASPHANLIALRGPSARPVRLSAHGRISALAWNERGDELAIGDEAGWVAVWSASGHRLRSRRVATVSIDALAYSSAAKQQLLAAVSGPTVAILNGQIEEVHKFRCNAATNPLIGWSPMRGTLAVLSENGLLQFWHEETGDSEVIDGKLVGNERPAGMLNHLLAWSANGELLLTNGGTVMLKLWDANGKPRSGLNIPSNLRSIPIQEPRPTSIAWSPDGNRFAGSGHVWDNDGNYVGSLTAATGVVDWSRRTHLLAAIGLDETVRIWREDREPPEWNAGKEVRPIHWTEVAAMLTANRERVGHSSLRWAADGVHLALASSSRVWLWSAARVSSSNELREARAVSLPDYISPRRDKVAVCRSFVTERGAMTSAIEVYDVATHSSKKVADAALGHSVERLSWATDDRRFATAGDDRTVRVWSMDGGSPITVGRHADIVETIAWSPDQTLIASGGWDGGIGIWRPNGGGKMLNKHIDPITDVQWSPDSQLIASASSSTRDRSPRFTDFGSHHPRGVNDPIRIWRRDGTLLHELHHQRMGVEMLSWSPMGDYLAAPYGQDSVRIWDRQGRAVATLHTDFNEFTAIAWSRDSEKLALAGHSNVAWLFSRSGVLLGKVAHSSEADMITLVAWSPDGRMLVTYGRDYVVRGWWSDGSEGAILSSDVPVRELWWSEDGSRVGAVGHWKDIVRIWGEASGERHQLLTDIGRQVALRLRGFETEFEK